jgi:hypothetical protein
MSVCFSYMFVCQLHMFGPSYKAVVITTTQLYMFGPSYEAVVITTTQLHMFGPSYKAVVITTTQLYMFGPSYKAVVITTTQFKEREITEVRIKIFCDVSVCRWASSCRHFE